MRIVIFEMKKIWSSKLLLVLAVLCTMFYALFMEFYITHFPNGHPITEEVDHSTQMTLRYGPTLEQEEYAAYVGETRRELILQAEAYIRDNPVFSEVGIFTYGDYEEIYQKSQQTEAENRAIWTLLGEEAGFVRFKLQALEQVEQAYTGYSESTLKNAILEARNERELARLEEIRVTEEYTNIMDGWVFENTVTYTIYLAILAVMSVLVLVAPLLVTDRTRNVHLLQYTTKQGRSILLKQLIAVLLSAFLLTTAQLLIFGAIYSTNKVGPFWHNGLTSFFNTGTFCWFKLTYGQYLIAYTAMLYILCLGVGAIGFVISRFSQHLVDLFLKLIPVFGMLGALCVGLFLVVFTFQNRLYAGTGIVGIEPAVCLLLLLGGMSLAVYVIRREKKVDTV